MAACVLARRSVGAISAAARIANRAFAREEDFCTGGGYTKGAGPGNSEEKKFASGIFDVAASVPLLLNGRVRNMGAAKFFKPFHTSYWLAVSFCALLGNAGFCAEKPKATPKPKAAPKAKGA